MSDEKYISTKEAAEILDVSARSVVGLCSKGTFEGAKKEGRSWKIPKDAVYAYGTIRDPGKKSDKLLSCSAGSTSYIEMVQKSYYVDKTLLIRDLIDDQVPVILFARPRRFGKTLTLDMLKSFFEKTNEDTSVYFRDKKIWACGEMYQKYQGAFPVISITFRDAKFDDWKKTFDAMKAVIRDEYLRHVELFSSARLNSVELDYLERLKTGKLSEVEYSRSLLYLGQMLEKHHGSKVVILIDEYDTPIQQGHSRKFYDEVITFMRNFMSGGLKDNRSLAFGILTGILRVSKENLFSGLNNIVVNSILDEKYSEYFGFTEDEVKAMASYYGKADKMTEIREWYDGYRFGNTEIYNPWSVVSYFFNNCKGRPYWTNTSDNEIIREIILSLSSDMADELFSLLTGRAVLASLHMDVIYPKIVDGTDNIFSFLLLAGYLKSNGVVRETDFGSFAELSLPNKEIKRVYDTEILSWLKATVNGNVMKGIERALLFSDGKKLKEALGQYMITCISCFDGAYEGFYHGMMLGLVAAMSSCYYIRSNRESGEGRFDLTLEPKARFLPGILMEFKAVKDEKELAKESLKALKQIDEKHYDTDLADRGITDIVKYGIAFAGKKVELIQG